MKSKFPNKISAKNKAFSIIELIIAIFVIAVGLLAVYGVSQNILAETIISVSRFEAAYLAQEGLEIVRNIRDNNIISGDDWNAGFEDCDPGQSYFCQAEYRDLSLTSKSASEEPDYLRFENVFYNYTSGSLTKFKRKILIEPVEEDKIDVSVEIIWEEKGKEHNLLLEASLYEWK